MIIYSILAAGLVPTGALAGETVKRQPCIKEQAQQPQQRQQVKDQEQQPRTKRQGCPVVRIPPVVDPTPMFIL